MGKYLLIVGDKIKKGEYVEAEIYVYPDEEQGLTALGQHARQERWTALIPLDFEPDGVYTSYYYPRKGDQYFNEVTTDYTTT